MYITIFIPQAPRGTSLLSEGSLNLSVILPFFSPNLKKRFVCLILVESVILPFFSPNLKKVRLSDRIGVKIRVVRVRVRVGGGMRVGILC